MLTLVVSFQLQLLSVDVLMQLLRKKITVRENISYVLHSFSNQKFPKNDPLPIDPYNVDK